MSEITPEKVAAALTGGDDVNEVLNRWVDVNAIPGSSAVRITVTPISDDGDPDTENAQHFRAVVVEGETDPIVLPAGAACDYINGDNGYHWLTCGTCEESMGQITAGTSVAEIVTKIAAHKCTPEAAQAEKGGTDA
ncbi:hypothetical protein ACIBK9_47405 [Nonomuraea sp. NPDC050227]|uniref:hypothetical protein n=1 Tax=Nonomuraea sp. NPDC050227 TaxID=3364360 RepID=UPI0037A68715